MIAVIFEVTVESGRGQDYLNLAAGLRDELEQTEGFVSIERFQSLTTENKFVSLSFWRDRAAVEAWYRRPNHKTAQDAGRGGIFEDYRIRVAEVFRDYDLAAGRPEI